MFREKKNKVQETKMGKKKTTVCQTNDIAQVKKKTWQRKGNLKREMESQIISAENNAKTTNYVTAKINKT